MLERDVILRHLRRRGAPTTGAGRRRGLLAPFGEVRHGRGSAIPTAQELDGVGTELPTVARVPFLVLVLAGNARMAARSRCNRSPIVSLSPRSLSR